MKIMMSDLKLREAWKFNVERGKTNKNKNFINALGSWKGAYKGMNYKCHEVQLIWPMKKRFLNIFRRMERQWQNH